MKYYETGSTDSSYSFNHLNDMYKYVRITFDEWVYGSGYYMDPGGDGYYKSVDGGFIRQLLYWGIIGSGISYLYGLLYFIIPYERCSKINDKIFIFIIFLYSIFIHYKGDLFSSSRFYHVILVFLFIPYVLNSQIKWKK